MTSQDLIVTFCAGVSLAAIVCLLFVISVLLFGHLFEKDD